MSTPARDITKLLESINDERVCTARRLAADIAGYVRRYQHECDAAAYASRVQLVWDVARMDGLTELVVAFTLDGELAGRRYEHNGEPCTFSELVDANDPEHQYDGADNALVLVDIAVLPVGGRTVFGMCDELVRTA